MQKNDQAKQTVVSSEPASMVVADRESFEELYRRHHAPDMGPLPMVAADSELAERVEGEYYLWQFHDTCAVGVRDLKVIEDFAVTTRLSDVLSLEFILSGGVDVELCGRELFDTGMPRGYLTSHRENGRQTRIYRAGDQIQSVGLWLPPGLLLDEYGLDLSRTSAMVQDIVSLATESTLTLPLTAKLQGVLEEIIKNPFSGRLSAKYLETKIGELLCHFCELLYAPEEHYEEDNPLSSHKARAMKQILLALNNNIANPPRPEELAARVGMSLSTLTHTFKSSFGVNISNYLLQRRMELSHQLLRAGKLSVMDVALTVGYENQSSFGRAYKKFFGHSPAADRPG